MMYRHVSIIMIICVVSACTQAGIFDSLRQKAEEKINETIDKAVEEAVDDVHPEEDKQTAPQNQPPPNTPASSADHVKITSLEDLYGQWEGLIRPGQSNFMSGMTVHIIISPESETMRISAAGTPNCLAELEPTDTPGQYRAAFIDEAQSCGSSALLTFSKNGNVTINFNDMPNADAESRIYSGQLTKSSTPYQRRWSTPGDTQNSLNIVGLSLGMTYEQVLGYLDEHHSDLERTVKLVTDAGTQSIILNLTESNAKKVGPAVFGEQITLVFESQTPEEIEVQQDPEVLAAIEEREKILQQRQDIMNQQRSDRRSRTRSASSTQSIDTQAQLPEIPEMPKLRPPGAESELLVISRQIQYPSRQGPHPDNVIEAMINKYGTPNILLKKPGSAGEQSLLGWVFDASGTFVEDAEGSACDLLSPTGYDLKALAHHYTVLMGGASGVFNPVWVSPACGLTMTTDIQTERDGSVWRIISSVYDQQRLLGDEWYRVEKLAQALVAEQKTKSTAIKERDIPDF